jgi:tocopherol cyclase
VTNGIFFEGWYYKLVLNEYKNTIVVIPGVHMNDNSRHSFIMVGYDNISHYYRFPFETFSSSAEEFLIKTDNEKNIFSYEKLIINLQPKDGDDATESFQMNLTLASHISIPDLSWIAPGTMGPYSWIPTMQCNHHVLSMSHDIHGSMQIDQNEKINISGIGYIEKDWGHSFPSMWVWGQANQWENLPATSSASLFFSLALIPWYFNLEFAGFLVVFEYNREFYRFNTYLQSIVNDLSIDNNTNQVSFNVYDVLFQYKLHITTHCDQSENTNGALLYGPRYGRMDKFVKEILGKNIYFDVRLSKLNQNLTSKKDDHDPFIQHGYHEEIIFQGRAQNVALEVTGNVNWLTEKFRATYENIYPWNFSFIRSFVQYSKFILGSVISLVIIWLFRLIKNFSNKSK